MIGDTVWAKFGESELRFGKIEERKMCNNWAYVRVNWVGDTALEMDRARVMELRGCDKYSDWYRIDKVSFFNKNELISKINKL